jgi:polyhydroxyalkanoate synthesis regulator phasin
VGYTRLQKRTEIARELNMRRKVYARMVADGRITQDEAERWIDIMQAIWSDYEEAADSRQKEFPFPS